MTNQPMIIESEDAMGEFAASLASTLPVPCRIYLDGNLGVGKTSLVRSYLRSLGYSGAVRSPSYTLIEPYAFADRTVVHMDLYRLADPEELEFLGLRDYLEGPVQWLVEWPEKGEGFLPAADLFLRISYGDSADQRMLLPSGELSKLIGGNA